MARRRIAPTLPPETGVVPVEFRDQLHPIWRDLELLCLHPVLCDYIDEAMASRLRMGGRVYHHVLDRWAAANGYKSAYGLTDHHALRAAGIIE